MDKTLNHAEVATEVSSISPVSRYAIFSGFFRIFISPVNICIFEKLFLVH